MGHSSPLVENDQKPRLDSIPGFSTWEFNSQLKNPVSDIKVYHCNSSNPVHFNRIEFSNLKYKDSLSFNWLTFEVLVLISIEKITIAINFQSSVTCYFIFSFMFRLFRVQGPSLSGDGAAGVQHPTNHLPERQKRTLAVGHSKIRQRYFNVTLIFNNN